LNILLIVFFVNDQKRKTPHPIKDLGFCLLRSAFFQPIKIESSTIDKVLYLVYNVSILKCIKSLEMEENMKKALFLLFTACLVFSPLPALAQSSLNDEAESFLRSYHKEINGHFQCFARELEWLKEMEEVIENIGQTKKDEEISKLIEKVQASLKEAFAFVSKNEKALAKQKLEPWEIQISLQRVKEMSERHGLISDALRLILKMQKKKLKDLEKLPPRPVKCLPLA